MNIKCCELYNETYIVNGSVDLLMLNRCISKKQTEDKWTQNLRGDIMTNVCKCKCHKTTKNKK